MMMDIGSFSRWAVRKGTVVEWGNLVGPYLGRQFRETFGNEVEAIERERQAMALEPISIGREPIALVRVRL